MVLKLDRSDIDKIYAEYVRLYDVEKMAGTKLSNIKSKNKITELVINNKQEFKTKTYGQIAQELLKQNMQQAISGEAVALYAPQLATDENLEALNDYIDIMPDGEEKKQIRQFYDDLAKVREGFNDILEHMKDDGYFEAAIDAIWHMTGNSELIHQMFSPDDGAERGDIFGAIMNTLSKK